MGKYLVREEIELCLEEVLLRRAVEFHFVFEYKNREKLLFCVADVPEDVFDRLERRAICEMLSVKDGVKYVTEEENSRSVVLARLRIEMGAFGGMDILKNSEVEKYRAKKE